MNACNQLLCLKRPNPLAEISVPLSAALMHLALTPRKPESGFKKLLKRKQKKREKTPQCQNTHILWSATLGFHRRWSNIWHTIFRGRYSGRDVISAVLIILYHMCPVIILLHTRASELICLDVTIEANTKDKVNRPFFPSFPLASWLMVYFEHSGREGGKTHLIFDWMIGFFFFYSLSFSFHQSGLISKGKLHMHTSIHLLLCSC